MPSAKQEKPALRGYLKSWSFSELFYWLVIPGVLLGVFGCYLLLHTLVGQQKGAGAPRSLGGMLLAFALLALGVALFFLLAYGVRRRERWAFKGLLAANLLTLAGYPWLIWQRLATLPADLAWYESAGFIFVLLVLPGLGLADESLALYRALRDPQWPPPRQVDPLDKR